VRGLSAGQGFQKVGAAILVKLSLLGKMPCQHAAFAARKRPSGTRRVIIYLQANQRILHNHATRRARSEGAGAA
jgi:hypothetical protein